MEFIQDTLERYRTVFNAAPEIVVTAPGRVNLIGEHTDYNGGFVLPLAIDRHLYVAAGPRNDGILSLHSADLQASLTIPLAALSFSSQALWTNYPQGVASVLHSRGYPVGGANLCIRGTIPIGAGLSSSAALEVACTVVLRQLNNLRIPLLEVIRIAQEAETRFVGVQCGIMDQFISVMGRKDHALFLDCRSLEHRHVPFPGGVALVIGDTGVRRELARSAYNQREAECNEAVRQIAELSKGVSCLRDVSPAAFEAVEGELSPLTRKRAHHVIHENRRVQDGVGALERGDVAGFGRLMAESHASLRDLFEVSCRELNAFVDIALATPGVYGARMTGAGFGGSAICLIAEQEVDALVDSLRTEYPKRAGRLLSIYLASPDEGVSAVFPHESLIPIGIGQLV